MKRPMIGVIPLYDRERSSNWMLPGYLEGLMEAGAFPVMLPLTKDRALLKQIAEQCSAFLFTGGQDVAPALYQEEMLPCCGEICPARDEMELALLPLVLERASVWEDPYIRICRHSAPPKWSIIKCRRMINRYTKLRWQNMNRFLSCWKRRNFR